MPYFKVLINGRGIDIQDEEGVTTIRGFFTTRLVRASDSSHAATTALAVVQASWAEGKHAKANRSGAPQLSVEEVIPSSFFESLRFKNTGHTFYATEEFNDA